jgi:hypothetical protein
MEQNTFYTSTESAADKPEEDIKNVNRDIRATLP